MSFRSRLSTTAVALFMPLGASLKIAGIRPSHAIAGGTADRSRLSFSPAHPISARETALNVIIDHMKILFVPG